MISGIGYTDDGVVWIQFHAQVNNEPHTGTIMLSPDNARQVSEKLIEASVLAEKCNVRNSSNTH